MLSIGRAGLLLEHWWRWWRRRRGRYPADGAVVLRPAKNSVVEVVPAQSTVAQLARDRAS